MDEREIVTPLTKLLLNVKMDALITFLNTIGVEWSLSKDEPKRFRAEIYEPNGGEEITHAAFHPYIPHHALAKAVSLFLMNADKDFHEYQGGE